MGAGAIRGVHAVRWGIAGNIMTAWILTIPAAAAVGAMMELITRLAGGDLIVFVLAGAHRTRRRSCAPDAGATVRTAAARRSREPLATLELPALPTGERLRENVQSSDDERRGTSAAAQPSACSLGSGDSEIAEDRDGQRRQRLVTVERDLLAAIDEVKSSGAVSPATRARPRSRRR